MNDYYESAEGIIISPERAKKEVEKHSASWEEFVQDMGCGTATKLRLFLPGLGTERKQKIIKKSS